VIKFLKHKKEYKSDMKLNKEFLRINQSNALFLEYAEFILNEMNNTNVFLETPFSFRGGLKSFIEKNKKSIVDLLFQTNTVLYLTHSHKSPSSEEDTKITKNYKTVSYQYYTPSAEHFDKMLYDIEEKKFCDKKKKCEILTEMKNNQNKNYAIVIVDITKDNIEVDETLKAKTYCKKIRRTLKRQLQPLLRAIMPRWGGSRTRRRKYCH
jgi:ligand-binding sensor protein